MKDLNKISRSIVKCLRHSPDAWNITLDQQGWTSVNSICSAFDITLEQLKQIVLTNNKQRFQLSSDMFQIRATQGHSIPLQIEESWTLVKDIKLLYHGTSRSNLESILNNGLLKGKRTHVHLSVDKETAAAVGLRKGADCILLSIDAELMIKSKYKIYRSTNGVYLTDHVPSRYIFI